jgi:hypothetical protein
MSKTREVVPVDKEEFEALKREVAQLRAVLMGNGTFKRDSGEFVDLYPKTGTS